MRAPATTESSEKSLTDTGAPGLECLDVLPTIQLSSTKRSPKIHAVRQNER